MVAFVLFGFSCQLALLAFFAAHLWRPDVEGPLGILVYGLGFVAVALAIASVVAGEPWWTVLAFVLYAVWAAFGTVIDLVRPIPWRQPPRWEIVVPYAALLIGTLFAFWIPLWWIDQRLWVAFGLLYAAHTTLNLLGHRSAPTPHGGASPS